MPMSSRYKDLFHASVTSDRLTLFQLLFDSRELNVDLTLALLRIIHKELCIRQSRDRSVYKRYAQAIESLRYHMTDVFRQVIEAWRPDGSAEDVEWLSDGVVK